MKRSLTELKPSQRAVLSVLTGDGVEKGPRPRQGSESRSRPKKVIEKTRPQEIEERCAQLVALAPRVWSGRKDNWVVPRFCGCGETLISRGRGRRSEEDDGVYRTSDDCAHVEVRESGGRVRFKGVWYCGNGYMCLRCGPVVARFYGEVLTEVVRRWQKENGWGSVLLLTVTMPHKSYQSLEWLHEALQGAWSDVFSSGTRKDRWRAKFDYDGFYRAFDLTHGEKNGWHPHLHSLLFLLRELDEQELVALQLELFKAFKARLEAKGLEAPMLEFVRLEVPRSSKSLSKYLAKCAGMGMSDAERLSMEVAGSGIKRRRHGKKGRRTLREILEDTADFGGEDNEALFKEVVRGLAFKRLWGRSTKGKLADLWREVEKEVSSRWEEEKEGGEVLLRFPVWMYEAARKDRWLWMILFLVKDEVARDELEAGVEEIWRSLPIVSKGYRFGEGWVSEARRAPPLAERSDEVRDWLVRAFVVAGRPIPEVLCAGALAQDGSKAGVVLEGVPF